MRPLDKYVQLIRLFVSKEISAHEFQEEYLREFKREVACMPEDQYQTLDTLFGDADSYTEDLELRKQNPSFYLDENELLNKAKIALSALKKSTS